MCQAAGALLRCLSSGPLRIYLKASKDQVHSTIISKCESETKLTHKLTDRRLLIYSYCVLLELTHLVGRMVEQLTEMEHTARSGGHGIPAGLLGGAKRWD